jgi:glycerophosphoryl diester phosphodiesterase
MPRLRHYASRVLLLFLLWSASNLSAVEIIAHRGASFEAPENTLAAMQLAWHQQADAIELDLWLSKDGRLVVFHDADTKRFEDTPRNITGLTWKETQQVDVGGWKAPSFKGTRIPSLDSILTTIPEGHRAVLEIKCGPEIVPELARVIQASQRPPNQIVIISFSFEALQASKKMFPKVEHYFLHDYKKQAPHGQYPALAPLIARAKEAGFEGLNLHFNWPINKNFVHEVKAAGLKLYVWTVDDPAVARRLKEAGVDGLTTNRPQWLREQLN